MTAQSAAPHQNTAASPAVTADGSQAISFDFQCNGHLFTSWMESDGDQHRLSIACDVGNLPYSAENRDGRRSALVLLSRAGDLHGTHLILTNYHKVSLIRSSTISGDHDPVTLISHAAASVMNTMPLIEFVKGCLSPATGR